MMTESQARERVAELRAAIPSLQVPLTWPTLRRLFAADDRLVITTHRVGPKARIRAMGDVGVISFRVGLSDQERLFAGAHEWAHWILHGSHDEPVRGFVARRKRASDPLELEADFFARCLLAGPAADVAYFTPPRPKRSKSKPNPLRWWLDPRSDPYLHPYHVGLGQAPLHWTEARGPRIRRKVPKDELLPGEPAIVYGRLFGPTFYRDRDGVRWEMHDATVDLVDGTIVRKEVDLGSPRALYRYFVGPTERRSYRFARWEQRDVKIKHLERQMRESNVITPIARSKEKQA